MCKLSLAAKSHADSADNFSHRLSHQEIIKLFFVGLCWILAALTEDMPADRKNCTKLHLLLRCAMLGRVMMPIGTASCTACNTRFIISPSPSGLPYGLPFGREHFVVVERQNTARPFTWHAASLQGGIAVVATKKLHPIAPIAERRNTARLFTRHAASLPVRCSLLAVRFNL